MLKNRRGFSLTELMVATLILGIVFAIAQMMLLSSQSAWSTTNTNITLQENSRQTLTRVGKEISEIGTDSGGTLQLTIFNGTGFGGSDIIRFSIPLCLCGASVMDNNGDVTDWGAPLKWGINGCGAEIIATCNTTNNKYIQYQMNSDGQLLRQVLNDAASSVTKTDIFAQNLTDFQAALNGGQTVVTLSITLAGNTDQNRQLSSSRSLQIFLKNVR